MGLQSASGGLTKSKLALATADPSAVMEGFTFYSGDKNLKTGIIPDRNTVGKNACIGMNNNYPEVALSQGSQLQLTSALDGNDYVAMQPPYGVYFGDSYVGTSIYQVASVAMKYGNTIYNHLHTGDNWTETKYWNVKKGEVYVIVALGFAQDSNIGNGQSSINTPNCTNLFNVDVNVTASTGYANRPLKVRCVRVDANTQISGYVRCGAGFAATYLGCFRIL